MCVVYMQMIAGDEVLANQAAAAAQGIKQECESDLAEAIPALEAAISALDTLKPADITEVDEGAHFVRFRVFNKTS